ncbi:MAG: DUF6056 family protein [Anaerolineaceae bacterium]|nr:DUF6056 family protein [Anaerolineaceae bacterium]
MKFSLRTLLAAVLSPLLALAGLAYLGTFTRLHADDFCMASSMARLGFWVSVSQWYTQWTGRFMFIISTHLLSMTDPAGAAVFPVIVIVVWLLGLTWALIPLLRHNQLPLSGWLALAASGSILLILFSTTPNLFQSVFWQDGQINYAFPMIGLTLLGGVILRAWLEPAWPPAVFYITGFVLAFVSGGYTEVYDAAQAALLALVLVLVLILSDKETRRRLVPVLGTALAGALIAVVIVIIAPGNQVRQAATGHSVTGLLRLIPFSLRNAAYIFGKYLLWNPGWALFSVLAPFLTGWGLNAGANAVHPRINFRALWSQMWFRGLILIPICSFLLVAAACAPSAYAMNAYPDDRSILVPQGLVVLAAVLSSAFLGAGLRRLGILPDPAERSGLQRILLTAILAVTIAASAFSLWQTVRQTPDYQSYTSNWDQRATVLLNARQQGQTEITVYGLTNRFGVSDLEAAPDYWVNKCMADYYGFSTIRGK